MIAAWAICPFIFSWSHYARATYFISNLYASEGHVISDGHCNLVEAIACINSNADANGCVDSGGTGHPDGQIYLNTGLIGGAPPVYVFDNTQTINSGKSVYLSAGDLPGDSFIQSSDANGVFNVVGSLTLSGGTARHSGTGNGRVIKNVGTLLLIYAGIKSGKVTGTCSGGTITGCGGGIYNEGTATVSGSFVSGCSASKGGGIYNKGELNVTSATIGGQVYYGDTSGPLQGNSATDGGGIYNDSHITATPGVSLTTSTVSYNTANTSSGKGGGVYSWERFYGTTSTIAFNKAANGGGVYALSNPNVATEYLELYSCTVAYNKAETCNASGGNCQTGGGVYAEGAFAGTRSQYSLFSNNTRNHSGTYEASDYFGEPHGEVYPSTEGKTFFQSNVNISHWNNNSDVTGNPLLSSTLTDLGGPTLVLPLGAGSPAINTAASSALSYDQTGWARPQGTGYDYGAVEYR